MAIQAIEFNDGPNNGSTGDIPDYVLARADALYDKGDYEGAHSILNRWEQGFLPPLALTATEVSLELPDPNQEHLFTAAS